MLNLFGNLYYIDFEALDKVLTIEGTELKNNILETKKVVRTSGNGGDITKVIKQESYKPKEVNLARFEVIRNFIEDLALASDSNQTDYDDTLGSRNLRKMPTRFKLAYNTLMFYNILRKVD